MTPATDTCPQQFQAHIAHLWRTMTDCSLRGHPTSLNRLRWEAIQSRGPNYSSLVDYVGYCERSVMQLLLYPGSYRERPRLNRNGKRTVRRGPGPGKDCFMRGNDWQELVAIAHQVTPGRYCGFSLTNYDAFAHPQPIYRSIPGTKFLHTEGGLGMLGALKDAIPDFGQTVFATMRTLAAIYAQYQYMRRTGNLRTAPLVTCVQDHYYATKLAWKPFKPQQVVLFDNKYSLNLFKQARHSEGRIAVMPNLLDRFNDSWDYLPTILQDLQKTARPWRDVLYKLVVKASRSQAEHQIHLAQFLAELNWPREEYADLFWACTATREAFAALAPNPAFEPILKKLRQLKNAVVPSNAQRSLWPSEPNATAIDVQIHRKLVSSTQQVFFKGVLTDLARHQQPFRASAEQLQKQGLISYVEQQASIQGIELNLPPQATWSKYQRVIKNRYLRPVEQADQVGFVQRKTSQAWEFCLPQFGIREGVVNTALKTPLLFDSTPGRNIVPPTEFTKEQIAESLEVSARNSLLWASLFLAYQQIIAPVEGHAPWRFALVGPGAQQFAASLARALDTTLLPAPRPRSWAYQLGKLSKAVARYHWPIGVQTAGRSKATICNLLGSVAGQNSFLAIPNSLREEAERTKWAILKIPSTADCDQCWEDSFRQMLMHCIRSYRGFVPSHNRRRKEDWLARITNRLTSNFKPQKRLKMMLNAAKRIITPSAD